MCEYTYALRAEEIRRALWTTRRSPLKAGIQTGLLALLAVSAWVGLIRGDRSGGTWLLAIAMPLLTAAVWLIPVISFRREAAAAAPLPVTLRLSEEEIGAGDVTRPVGEASLLAAGDLVIWRVDKYQSVVIRRRALPPEAWDRLEKTAKG